MSWATDFDLDMSRIEAAFAGRDETKVPDDIVLFTITETAHWFGVSRNLIQREVAKGRIQVHKLGEGTKTSPVRISLTEVRRYLRDRVRRGLPVKR